MCAVKRLSISVLPHADMPRTRYLISYDICDEKRLRRVAKALSGFGYRIQYSVFECCLEPMRLAQCKAELDALIHHDDDQVLFIKLGDVDADPGLLIEALGKPFVRHTNLVIV